MPLIEDLIKSGWLKTPEIINAFQKIKRVDFLPEDMKDLAELNEALPIGHGQTISQPLVVAFMIELLEPKKGEKILDVGSGSGWTTALLADNVSQQGGNQTSNIKNQKGRVIALEIVPELKEFGEKNVAKYNFIKKGVAQFICADGSKGYEKEAPYDKILASASVFPSSKSGMGVQNLPLSWKTQLKVNGRIVTPIANSIWLFIKNPPAGGETDFEETEYPGFVFVPLIEK